MLRFAESGGQYHASNAAGPGVWASATGGPNGGATARNGSTWAYGNSGPLITPSFGVQSTLIAGCAIFVSSFSSGQALIVFTRLGASQCDLRMDASGHLFFTRNGTTIGGTSTNVLTTGAWHYFEFKAIFSTTGTGTCEVVVDGSTWLTSTSLTNATTAAEADQVSFGQNSGNIPWSRDFYVLDTTTGSNTNYLGDITVGEYYDNAPGVNSAWSVQQASFVLTQAANASGGTTVYTGTITNGASPTNAWQGFYYNVAGFTNGANNGGPWLCTASTATTITLQNPSGVAETHAGTCAFQNPLQAGIHGGDIDNATTNLGTRPPGDNQFIFDATAGDKSDFGHQTLSLTGTIAAVVHTTLARKDDAGTRQFAQICESTGTEEIGATQNLTGTYTYYKDYIEQDPHTSAQWSVSGYNAATFGVKEIS